MGRRFLLKLSQKTCQFRNQQSFMLSGERQGCISFGFYISFSFCACGSGTFFNRKQSTKKIFQQMKKQFFLVAATIISSSLLAQQDSASTLLDDVMITANRLPQKQSQTGKVITIIGREVLDKSPGRSVTQVLNDQAGITINGALNNMGTVQTTYMRGANSGRTLVLLDGMPVSDPSQINNEFDLNLLLVNDVERIEIARGAQSTLYGSDAVAGVINIITQKQNVQQPFHFKSSLSAGNRDTYRGSLQGYGRVGKFSYQLKAAGLSSQGFSTAQDTTGSQNFDNDYFRGSTTSAALQYQASSQLQFKTFVQYNHYKTELDGGVYRDDKDFTQRSGNLNTGAGFNFKTNTVNVTGNYMYSQSSRNFLNDSGSISGFAKYEKDDYDGRNQFVELFASIQLGSGFTLLQGADYRFNSFSNNYLSISGFGNFNSSIKDTGISQQSMYASLLYQGAGQKLNIEAGGRLNVNSRYGTNYTYTFNPSYAFSKNWRMFGSIATGFKAPSLYQLFSFAGNTNLRPEESINYEIGAQHTAKNIRHRAVYFYREIKTGLDFDYINFVYYNIPNQIVRGIEYELTATPVKNLTLTANYTYIAGNEFVQSRLTTKDTAYRYLLRRPAHHININVGYQFSSGFYAALQAKTISRRWDAGGYQQPDIPLGGYVLLSAYAAYKYKKHFQIFTDLQNITNKRFYDLRGFNSIPFTIQAGIAVNL
jgi:vitamin B12 transporter